MKYESMSELRAKRDAIQKKAESLFSVYFKSGYMGFTICESNVVTKGKKYKSYVASRKINGKQHQVRITDIFDIEEKIQDYIRRKKIT